MVKRYKGGARKKPNNHKRETRIRTWTRDENTPFAETEYPFEHAVMIGEYSELYKRERSPGLKIYLSTICISRQDLYDSYALALLGEHFREFFPGEMPWLSKSTAQMCKAMTISDVEELNETLNYLVDEGFLGLDLSTPDVYRYRLNVDAVRRAKNACFKPTNALGSN